LDHVGIDAQGEAQVAQPLVAFVHRQVHGAQVHVGTREAVVLGQAALLADGDRLVEQVTRVRQLACLEGGDGLAVQIQHATRGDLGGRAGTQRQRAGDRKEGSNDQTAT
jgi:hypothetical protein